MEPSNPLSDRKAKLKNDPEIDDLKRLTTTKEAVLPHVELKQCGALLGYLRRRLLPLSVYITEEDLLTNLLAEHLAESLTELAHTARQQVLGRPVQVPVAQAKETAAAGELLGLTDEDDFDRRLEHCEGIAKDLEKEKLFRDLNANLAEAASPKRASSQIPRLVGRSENFVAHIRTGRAKIAWCNAGCPAPTSKKT